MKKKQSIGDKYRYSSDIIIIDEYGNRSEFTDTEMTYVGNVPDEQTKDNSSVWHLYGI